NGLPTTHNGEPGSDPRKQEQRKQPSQRLRGRQPTRRVHPSPNGSCPILKRVNSLLLKSASPKPSGLFKPNALPWKILQSPATAPASSRSLQKLKRPWGSWSCSTHGGPS